jgi:hypothetical protein
MTADRGRKNIIGKLRVRCTHMKGSVASESDAVEAPPRKKPRVVQLTGGARTSSVLLLGISREPRVVACAGDDGRGGGGGGAAGGAGGASAAGVVGVGGGALRGGRAAEEEAGHCMWEGILDNMAYHLSHQCGFVVSLSFARSLLPLSVCVCTACSSTVRTGV